jgi:membrane-bound serine protease (ClpP class)
MRSLTKFLLIIIDELLIGFFLIFLLYHFDVDIWVFGLVIVILASLITFIAYIFLPQLKQPVTGAEGMVGMTGVVVETLNPNGTVRIRGELWNAVSINGLIEREEKAMVEKVNGLNLLVKKLKKR